jgi:D-arabinose 5-phosphate isomerase GutQ
MGIGERLLDQSSAIAHVAERNAAELEELAAVCEDTLRRGHQLVVTALGKNVPICEKFAGTLNSFGLAARFLHSNSAVHGDLGILSEDDLLIIVSKSGATSESLNLAHQVAGRSVVTWSLTCTGGSPLGALTRRETVVDLLHEGDLWDLAPVNSSIVFLAVFNAIAVELAERLEVPLERFLSNHPGGSIGERGRRLAHPASPE